LRLVPVRFLVVVFFFVTFLRAIFSSPLGLFKAAGKEQTKPAARFSRERETF
jgi:hypothetical protein